MRIITRYLIHEFIKIFFMTLSGFVGIFLVVDFFEKIDNFMEAGVGSHMIAEYYLLQVPIVTQQILPAAILLSTIITLSLMAMHRELIVLGNCGISLFRLTLPLIVLSFLFTGLLFFLNEVLLPPVHERVHQIWTVEVQKKPMKAAFRNERLWYRGKGVIYHIDYFDAKRSLMNGVTLYRFSPAFELLERTDARSAQWMGDRWRFRDGIQQKKSGRGVYTVEKFAERDMDIAETPDDFALTMKKPEELNLPDLMTYVGRLSREGYNVSSLETDVQAKLSFPFVCVVMMVMGIPLSLRNEKKIGIAAGVGVGILLAFLYWVVHSISVTSGHAGLSPPLIAAWLANIVFLGGGVIFLSMIRQ